MSARISVNNIASGMPCASPVTEPGRARQLKATIAWRREAMDESRFDAWTRRRFGYGAGGLAASLLGVAGAGEAEGEGKGKKNRKKRDKGDARDAAKHLHDAKHKNHGHHHKHKKKKCKKAGTGCNPNNPRCCASLHCQAIPGFGGQRCCNENNVSCSRDQECCSGLCFQGSCAVILS